MGDLPPPVLDPAQGARLAHAAYYRDFRERDAAAHGLDSWKFERRQHFEEVNDPSREALRRGDWEEALRLNEDEREDVLKSVRQDQERGNAFYRVRVVEEPLTPYLRWELHALRIRAECGRGIRVVRVGTVSPLESDSLLPEVVVLGGRALYHILYTDEGIPQGAILFTDLGVVKGWETFIKRLYEDGEDVISYCDRHAVRRPPPQLT